MALSGLEIYKLLPKTNCRKCGFPTCLAFAMQLAAKKVSLDRCPCVSEDAKRALASAAEPPIRLVTAGSGKDAFSVGNETVLFRHDETFYHETAIGFLIDASDKDISGKIEEINKLSFERVGQKIKVNLIALKDDEEDAGRFGETAEKVIQLTSLPVMLISGSVGSLKSAAGACKERRPILYCATEKNSAEIAGIAGELGLPVVASAQDPDALASLTRTLSGKGLRDIILEAQAGGAALKIEALTRIRRLALRKNFRPLGYPTIVFTQAADAFQETAEAASYIAKYASIVIMRGMESWQVLPLLTERQNIFTDPQKPLQVAPGLYEIGKVTPSSPLIVTTNFSLTYYTVESEVEASRIPAYILCGDCEGMSVLTAWAADKFGAEVIAKAMRDAGVDDKMKHNTVIIPGYVAVVSAKLAGESGKKVLVGPREASGLPRFLKQLGI